MSTKSDETNVDPAALVVAAFVAAWPLFSEPGPFVHWSFVVGVTLLLVICSYEFARCRTRWQSLAFGAVCALPSILAYGFIREMWKAGWRFATEDGAPWYTDLNGNAVLDTRITSIELSWAWMVFTLLFFGIGCLGSRRAAKRHLNAHGHQHP